MRVAQGNNFEETVYMQEHSCGVNAHGVEIQNAAGKLGRHMGVEKNGYGDLEITMARVTLLLVIKLPVH